MAAFCPNCGSPIDAGAKFCQNCGTAAPSPQAAPPPQPQWTPPAASPPPAGAPMAPGGISNKTKSILLGGLVAGLLSGIPFISAGNLCCCLWVLLGGVLAVYLYSREVPMLTSGDAALLGLQSGMVAAVVSTLISIPVRFFITRFFGAVQQQMLQKMFEQNPDFPPQLRGLMQSILSPGFMIGAILVGFVFALIFYSIFGALGGLLGNAMFKKKTQ